MNYSIFFGIYLIIVMIFWIIIAIYAIKRKTMTLLTAISWLVASANVIGMVLFLCYKDSFINKEP